MMAQATAGRSDEDAIRGLADALFVTTDRKEWASGRALFVDGLIDVDMSSLAGGGPVRITADELYQGFRKGLHSGKASHHMATNYQVRIAGEQAELWAQGYAWNHVAALPEGANLWETWGTYRLTCRRTPAGWRLDGFHYYSRLTRGSDAVRTHSG
jgi:hypothetical protein